MSQARLDLTALGTDPTVGKEAVDVYGGGNSVEGGSSAGDGAAATTGSGAGTPNAGGDSDGSPAPTADAPPSAANSEVASAEPVANSSSPIDSLINSVRGVLSPQDVSKVNKDQKVGDRLRATDQSLSQFVNNVNASLPGKASVGDFAGNFSLADVEEYSNRANQELGSAVYSSLTTEHLFDMFRKVGEYTRIAGQWVCRQFESGLGGLGLGNWEFPDLGLLAAHLWAALKGALDNCLVDTVTSIIKGDKTVGGVLKDKVLLDLLPSAVKSKSPAVVDVIIDELSPNVKPATRMATVKSVLGAYTLAKTAKPSQYEDNAFALIAKLDALDPKWDKVNRNDSSAGRLSNYRYASDDALTVLAVTGRTRHAVAAERRSRSRTSDTRSTIDGQYPLLNGLW